MIRMLKVPVVDLEETRIRIEPCFFLYLVEEEPETLDWNHCEMLMEFFRLVGFVFTPELAFLDILIIHKYQSPKLIIRGHESLIIVFGQMC